MMDICHSAAGLLTILVKSIGNTNINTLAKNYRQYQYRYCCRKVLTILIPILLQAILFLLIQQSQVRLRRGPAGCASFFLCWCGSQLQQWVRFCMPHIFHLKLTKSPLPMRDSIEQRQQSGLIFLFAMRAIRLVVQIRNAAYRQWHLYIVIKNFYHYDTHHTTNGCPLFVKWQKAESFFCLDALPQETTGPEGSTASPLLIKFVNPPRVMLCLVACWCSDLVNLVVAMEMELSTDLNETHENQDSRKNSTSRIIFLALENWTVWIGRNKQLLVLVSESWSTIDRSN